MDSSLDFQEPDESRPAKRARLDGALEVTEDAQEEMVDDEDWGDIYGAEGGVAVTNAPPTTELEAPTAAIAQPTVPGAIATASANDTPQEAQTASAQLEPVPRVSADIDGATVEADPTTIPVAKAEDDGIPPEAVDTGADLVDEARHLPVEDEQAQSVLEQTTDVNADLSEVVNEAGGQAAENAQLPQLAIAHEELKVQDEVQAAMGTTQVDDDTRQMIDTPASHEETIANGESTALVTVSEDAPSTVKPLDDPAFLAAATAQKSNAEAEWNFSPSDAESSPDSDDTSDSDSDDTSDGGYEMLDPATMAKILMSGEGDDDDEGGKKKGGAGGDNQPRTANEAKEVAVPKPDVVITPEMKITLLGVVERVVETTVLIKGATPGEYQVLEVGSVLCNAAREVVGAVSDTFGKVSEPRYSVAFGSKTDIEDVGMTEGEKVWYVEEFSTYVFTQPLRGLKGTDASNIHDEEVGAEEMEFSDDEAEAEFKRQRKAAKRGGRGGGDRGGRGGRGGYVQDGGPTRSFGAPGGDADNESNFVHGSDAPQSSYGGGMSYDDDESAGPGATAPDEAFYTPLKRPDNLGQMMASGGPPRPSNQKSSHSDRGGDRGRGRGRGDRGNRGDRGGRGRGGDRGGRGGRGRGDFNNNDRGGGRGDRRGGANGNMQQHRGNAQSFPDRHNHDYHQRPEEPRHSLPPKPAFSPVLPPAPIHYNPAAATNAYQQQQQQPPAPNAQNYQFNGYQFQYGNAPPANLSAAPSYQPQPPQTQPAYNAYPQQSAPAVPGGAYINPAFFPAPQQQQQQQQAWSPQPQQPQQQYGAWAGQQQQQPQAAYGAMTPQQQQQNLAEILRRMGGQQPQ